MCAEVSYLTPRGGKCHDHNIPKDREREYSCHDTRGGISTENFTEEQSRHVKVVF